MCLLIFSSKRGSVKTMTSAFEAYKRKAKKPKPLSLGEEPKNARLQASTPLPESCARLFTPTNEPSTSRIFLSPISAEKKKKKKRKLNDSTPQTNGTCHDSQEAFHSSPKRKKSLKLDSGEVKGTKGEKKKKRALNGSVIQPVANGSGDDSQDAFHADAFRSSPKTDSGDSVKKGKNLLAWILSPIDVDEFFSSYWEKRPLYVQRRCPEYFQKICTIDGLFVAFKHCPIHLLKNVTVTSYENGKRKTDTTPGRARVNTVRDYFENGHSIRILNPQTFVPNVGSVVACLQEFFRCMVGVNSYLTPAGTQGFAPHYDDIEAFVLQMEGEKLWKVYPPRSERETLPRFSSVDFDQSELGEPMLEVTLKAGDLLYFPRGFIHQARSVEDQHSLHLTISAYQRNTWGDFFKIALPLALDQAIAGNVELREGIPLDFLDQMGVMNPTDSIQKTNLIHKATELFSKVVQSCPWDDAADQLGKEFIHSSYPPPTDELRPQSFRKLFGKSISKAQVRLITANAVRLAGEENDLVVYYSTDNSLEPRGEELLGFAVSEEEAAVLRTIKAEYPKYCKVSRLMDNKNLEPEAVSELICAMAQRALLDVQFLEKTKKSAKK